MLVEKENYKPQHQISSFSQSPFLLSEYIAFLVSCEPSKQHNPEYNQQFDV